MSFTTRLAVPALAAACLAAVATPRAAAVNVLVDPGFETGPLITLSASLNNFAANQGLWGQENATNSGPSDGVVPFAGAQMHRMLDDGLVVTQTTQVTDISGLATDIDLGNVTYASSAMYTGGQGLSAPIGAISLHFHTAASNGSPNTPANHASSLTLDGSPQTWQSIGVNGIVPAGTRWIYTQVYYSNASLLTATGASGAGMVDAAVTDIRVVPEPTTLAALAAAGTVLIRRRRA